jgi:pimeloyl-ACP methyl ester carboxylesterase
MRAIRPFAVLLPVVSTLACLAPPRPPEEVPGGTGPYADAIEYRALEEHPGCSTADLSYTPASIPGFQCAAKEYTTNEDTTKPIVILVHGNSDTPKGWESNTDPACDPAGPMQGAPMLAERLAQAGHKVIALDLRTAKVDDPAGNNDTENAAKNMSHGWGVPLAQHLIASVLDAYPGRQVSVVGFSFGATVVRDALRRLDVNDGVALWPRLQDVVLLAGGNHGVSTFPLCSSNPTMRGKVTCEMGDRAAFAPTPFLSALNGPEGAWETPCGASGDAFGRDVCEGHVVDYTTIVMEDIPGGTQQDTFVSEASSALAGAQNRTIGLGDFDTSDYFFCGLFKDHYGAARSSAALDIIVDALAH